MFLIHVIGLYIYYIVHMKYEHETLVYIRRKLKFRGLGQWKMHLDDWGVLIFNQIMEQ